MASEKPGVLAETPSNDRETPTTEARILPTERVGQSNAPEGATRTHILVITLSEKPGAVDRVVGLLRRRRAHLQTLTISHSEQPDVTRITAVIDDSEVVVEQLVEQIRKVVDVRRVSHLAPEQIVDRELALIKMTSDSQHSYDIIELGQQFGAYVADIAQETLTLEVVGTTEKIERLLLTLEPFGIREVARTGSVAMLRGTV